MISRMCVSAQDSVAEREEALLGLELKNWVTLW